MKSNQVFPSRWLKAADLEPHGETVTILKVTMEEIGEERERKPIMTFDETDKELVVNVTNWNSIAELTGEEDSDDWPGHVIKRTLQSAIRRKDGWCHPHRSPR